MTFDLAQIEKVYVAAIEMLPTPSAVLPWTPADFPSVQAWYDSTDADLPLIGNEVTDWPNPIRPADELFDASGGPEMVTGPAVRFDRSNTESMTTGAATSLFVDASSGLICVRARWNNPPASDEVNFWANEMVVAEGGGNVGIFARTATGGGDDYFVDDYIADGWSTSSIEIVCGLYDGSANELTFQAELGVWHTVLMRWNGSKMNASLGGGAELEVACGSVSALSAAFQVGGGGAVLAPYSDIDLSLIVCAKQQGADADRSELIGYAERTRYFGTHGFTTSSTDTPPDRHVPGRLLETSEISTRLRPTADGLFAGLIESANVGRFELANPDGALDYLLDFAVDGLPIRLLRGERAGGTITPITDMDLVSTTVGGYWEADLERLSLVTGDRGLRLRIPAQPKVYAGTGKGTDGHEGALDLAGRRKPLVRGWVLNAEPQLVDPGTLLYQLSSEPLASVLKVYDKLAPLTLDTAHSSFAALDAAVPGAGQYSTWLAGGMIKLGTIPVGRVTVDAIAGAQTTTADICLELLQSVAGLNEAELDTGAFAQLASSQPGQAGLYLPSGNADRVEDVVVALAAGVGAAIGEGQDGRYTVQRIEDPAGGTPVLSLTETDITDFFLEPLPYGVPVRSVTARFRRNYTVMSEDEIAGTANDNVRARAEKPWATVTAESADAGRIHQASANLVVETPFHNETDAEGEATRLVALYGFERMLIRIQAPRFTFAAGVGDLIQVTLNRYGLDAGKLFVVVAVDRAQQELTCFG